MLAKADGWLVRASRSPRLFAAITALAFGSLGFLFALENRFEALTGLPTFDTQNDLTPSALLEQLPRYQGEALEAYLRFAAFDFVFPFTAALFLAVTWALLLRVTPWRVAQRLLAWKLPLVAFFGTGFDYLENVSLLSTIFMDAPSVLALEAAILFKRLKLTALVLSNGLTGVLVLLASGSYLQRSGRARLCRGQEETTKGAIQEG